MSHVSAFVKVQGMKEEAEGIALVDAGASFTVMDESLADAIGVEIIDEEEVDVRGICYMVKGKLAVVKRIIIEGRMLGSTTAVIARLSREVKETLKRLGFRDDMILGVRDLTGFTIDIKERKLRYAGILLI